eukprot:7161459-Pyramimonas_sp.AAC.1
MAAPPERDSRNTPEEAASRRGVPLQRSPAFAAQAHVQGAGQGQKSKDRAPFDPRRWQQWIINKFLNDMSANNYRVDRWPSSAGVYADWDREQKLHQEVQKKRGVAK